MSAAALRRQKEEEARLEEQQRRQAELREKHAATIAASLGAGKPVFTVDNDAAAPWDGKACTGTVRLTKGVQVQGEWSTSALFFLPPNHALRMKLLNIVSSSAFESASLLVIILNCIAMMFQDPTDQDESSTLNTRLSLLDNIFFLPLFTLEMILKILAYGFFSTPSKTDAPMSSGYITSGWNKLDFVVVVIGYVSLFASGAGGLKSLRTFRVLRPLKTISSVPSMRLIVVALIRAVPALGNVLALCAFIFFIFGIIGVNLWKGRMSGVCAFDASQDFSIIDRSQWESTHAELISSADAFANPITTEMWTNESHWPTVEQGTATIDGVMKIRPSLVEQWPHSHGLVAADPNDEDRCDLDPSDPAERFGRVCDPVLLPLGLAADGTPQFAQLTRSCRDYMSPNFGYGGYDNIGLACQTIFTSITLEGWADHMYGTQDAWGRSGIVLVYFVFLILLGSWFLLNLALAVVWDEYDKAKSDHEEVERRLQDKLDALEAEMKANEIDPFAELEEVKKPPPALVGKCKYDAITTDITESDPGHTDLVDMTNGGQVKTFGLRMLVNHDRFKAFINALVILNTIALAVEHHEQPRWLTQILEACDWMFFLAFLFEMILKLYGIGWKEYAEDNFNLFDMVIVMFSVVEKVLAAVGGGGGIAGLSALRSFRLLRLFKLARSYKALMQLISTILQSVESVSNAGGIVLLVVFIFTLLGMNLFGGKWCLDDDQDCIDLVWGGEKPRAHFDSFGWSIVTVFQILTGENWNDVVYNSMRAGHWLVGVVYFTLLNVVGNYILLNLFLAILLANFEDDDEEDENDEEPEGAEDSKNKFGSKKVWPVDEEEDEDEAEPETMESITLETEEANQVASGSVLPTADREIIPLEGKTFGLLGPTHPFRLKCNEIVQSTWFDNKLIMPLIIISTVILAYNEPYYTRCCDLPDMKNKQDICEGECQGTVDLFKLIDVIFTVIFVLEMCLKIVTFTFKRYIAVGFNKLDFFIVIISILGIALEGQETPIPMNALKALRAMRALRPLRAISRAPGLKLVVDAIFESGPAIATVFLVSMFFFLILGIVAVQQWKGAISACTDPDFSGDHANMCNYTFVVSGDACSLLPDPRDGELCARRDLCHLISHNASREYCLEQTRFEMQAEWRSLPANFDNTGAAILTLYEIMSGEMWPDIMYTTVDAVGAYKPMVTDYNRYAAIYYIVAQLIAAFLLANLFAGVVCDTFNRIKEERKGSMLLTEDQQKWVECQRMMLQTRSARIFTTPPEGTSRRKVFDVVEGALFEKIIMVAIMANTMTLAMTHHTAGSGQSEAWTNFLAATNWIFTLTFTVEMFLKMHAYRKEYLSTAWNKFDFFIVLLSWIGKVPPISKMGSLLTLLRVLRVARIVKLVKTSQGLTNLFNTLLLSLPQIVNVGIMLLLTYFVFAVMGMNVFAFVKHQENITQHANFATLMNALSMLFRCSTGESFNGIMHDARLAEPYCDPNHLENCGVGWISVPYFVIFFMATEFFLLNLLIGIIIDNFSATTEASSAAVTAEHLEQMKMAFNKRDPKGSQIISGGRPGDADYVHVTSLIDEILMEVDYPLGVRGHPDARHRSSMRFQARKFRQQASLNIYDNKIHFQELMSGFSHRAFAGIEMPKDDKGRDLPLVREIEKQRKARTRTLRKKSGECVDAKELAAAELIQSLVRAKQARRRMRELIAESRKARGAVTGPDSAPKDEPQN